MKWPPRSLDFMSHNVVSWDCAGSVANSEEFKFGTQFMLHCERFRFVRRLGICKGKAIPLRAWTGREGSRRLRLQDFKTVGT